MGVSDLPLKGSCQAPLPPPVEEGPQQLAEPGAAASPQGRPGYAPLAAGMAAALPSVDAFVEGHSLAALEHLAAVVRGADHEA